MEPTMYDAILFNFGMHDIDYSKRFPEVSYVVDGRLWRISGYILVRLRKGEYFINKI